MSAKGTAIIDFGSSPGTFDCTTTVTGQSDIASDSSCEAWVSSEATDDHSVDEHCIAPIRLRIINVTAATGFTIQAVCDWQLTGQFNVRWVWV